MLLLIGAAATGPAQAGEVPGTLHVLLDTIWTTPLAKDPEQPLFNLGFSPGAWAEAPGGAVMLLGSMNSHRRSERLLLANADRAGPEAGIRLSFPESKPQGLQRPQALFWGTLEPNLGRGMASIAIGTDGGIWLGGWINQFMDVASSPHSDAYLARLDPAGTAVWDRAYSDNSELSISSIAVVASGGAAVAGHGRDTSWLARIGPDGARLAEWRIGNGKGVAVAPLRDGHVIVAGFADGGVTTAGPRRQAAQAAVQAGTYRDDVLMWMLDQTGQPRGPVLVREGISQDSSLIGPGAGGGTVAVAATGDTAYVVTNWLHVTRPAETEVARIGRDGAVLWRQRLPETVGPMGANRLQTCTPALAALPDGDALVACALGGQVQLHRLDGRTGRRSFASLAPPACQQGGYGARASLLARRDGTVFVSGSGLGNDGEAGCSWMARLSFGPR